jgi:hypothetical protein
MAIANKPLSRLSNGGIPKMTAEHQTEESSENQLKSIKVLDKVLLAFGGKKGRDVKFIAKDLSKTEHYTMVMRILNPDTLEVDFHATREGAVKEYEPIAKIQMDIKQWKQLKEEQFAELLKKSVHRIDVEKPDKELAEAAFVIVPNPLKGEKIRRRLELNADSLKALATGYESMTFAAFLASGTSVAVVVRERQRSMVFAFRSGTEMYLLNLDRLMNGLSKLLGFDKLEEVISEALEGYEERKRQARVGS